MSMGSAPVFVDEAKKAVWTIDNPDAVKAFYGDHVTITATADSGQEERPHRRMEPPPSRGLRHIRHPKSGLAMPANLC
jgi:hypothetical protein